MAAKKITTHRIICHTEDEAAAQRLAIHIGKAFIHERDTIVDWVCPHCGKPWPMHRTKPFGPLSLLEFRRASAAEALSGYTYCCDATQLDCKGT